MNKPLYTFVYQGWNASGQLICAQIYAEHLLLAKSNLVAQGILIKNIRRKLFAQRLTFSAQNLLFMTEQLAVLISASLPLIFCLNILAKQFKPMMHNILHHMIQMIAQGENFSSALQRYSYIFPTYFIRLIQVGEESGQLGLVLTQLAAYQEKILTRTAQLKKALFYPVFVLIISLFITLALLLFIVPQFQLLFTDVSASLPAMTQFVFKLADLLQQLQIMHGTVFFIILISLLYSTRRHPKYLIWKQELLFQLPFVGKIIHDSQQTRYLRSLSLALGAGLPLMNALSLASQVIQHTRLARKIILIPKQVSSGISLRQTFKQTTQFCEIVIQLVTIGEQTSQLPTLLMQGAKVLEQRIDQQMQQFTSLLQPILVIILGIVLGCLIIALYMPVFKLGTLY